MLHVLAFQCGWVELGAEVAWLDRQCPAPAQLEPGVEGMEKPLGEPGPAQSSSQPLEQL